MHVGRRVAKRDKLPHRRPRGGRHVQRVRESEDALRERELGEHSDVERERTQVKRRRYVLSSAAESLCTLLVHSHCTLDESATSVSWLRAASQQQQQGGSSGAPVFTGGMLVGVLLCVALLAGGWFGMRYVRKRRALHAMQQHGFVEPPMYAP